MELLKSELNQDERHIKVAAVRRLTLIAKVLGPEQARSLLLPFIIERTRADEGECEDEVLLAIAEQLGSMTLEIGGPKECMALLEPLEACAGNEELVAFLHTRDKAVPNSR